MVPVVTAAGVPATDDSGRGACGAVAPKVWMQPWQECDQPAGHPRFELYGQLYDHRCGAVHWNGDHSAARRDFGRERPHERNQREHHSTPARPGTADELREEMAAEFARHGSTMDYRWDRDENVRLGCMCGYERGVVTKAELAADLSGFVQQWREHVADDVLALPRVQRLLAVEQRVRGLADEAERRGREDPFRDFEGNWHPFPITPTELRRALGGEQR